MLCSIEITESICSFWKEGKITQLNNLRRGNAQSQKGSKSNYQLHELWGTFKWHHCLQSANSPHGRCCKTKTPVSSKKTVQEKRKRNCRWKRTREMYQLDNAWTSDTTEQTWREAPRQSERWSTVWERVGAGEVLSHFSLVVIIVVQIFHPPPKQLYY